MSHSYTMTVGSVGKYGFNQGVYLNTMQWRLADPLFMQIRLGYAHQPFRAVGAVRAVPARGSVFRAAGLSGVQALQEHDPESRVSVDSQLHDHDNSLWPGRRPLILSLMASHCFATPWAENPVSRSFSCQ